MNRPTFISSFAGEIDVYLDYRQATGILIAKIEPGMESLITPCAQQGGLVMETN